LQFFGTEAKQKVDAEGQGDIITENSSGVKKQTGKEDKEEQLAAGDPERFAQSPPQDHHQPGHQQVYGGKQSQLHMGQKRPGHGKEIKFVGQMFLDKVQQMRREKEYQQGAATKGQGQIANGFPQFDNKGNDFCMCRHGNISGVPVKAVSVAVWKTPVGSGSAGQGIRSMAKLQFDRG
jgi:hypothetical protein